MISVGALILQRDTHWLRLLLIYRKVYAIKPEKVVGLKSRSSDNSDFLPMQSGIIHGRTD